MRGEVAVDRIHTDVWRFPMPLMCTAFEPGTLDKTLDMMLKDDYGVIAQAEAHYYRGCPDEARRLAEPYLLSDDLSLRLSACLLCTYANLSLNRALAARRCLAYLEETGKGQGAAKDPRAQASYMLLAASACCCTFPRRCRAANSIHMHRCCPRGCACLRPMRWRTAPVLMAITVVAWAWRRMPCR